MANRNLSTIYEELGNLELVDGQTLGRTSFFDALKKVCITTLV